MTKQNQDISLSELIDAKLEADDRNIQALISEVSEAFVGNQQQIELLTKLAVKLYHNSSDVDEMNVQGMYISAVVDALSKLLVDDKQIITHEELQKAVEEAHDISMASIEEANKLFAEKMESHDDGNSEVITV